MRLNRKCPLKFLSESLQCLYADRRGQHRNQPIRQFCLAGKDVRRSVSLDGDKHMTTNCTALGLGATGGVGGEVARQLIAKSGSASAPCSATPISCRLWQKPRIGFASRPSFRQACSCCGPRRGSHRARCEPAGLPQLGELVLPMLDNTIAAALRKILRSICSHRNPDP